MKRLLAAILITGLASVTLTPREVSAQVCNGGTITGATGNIICSPTGCIEGVDPGCSCSLSCAGVTYAVEYCSDYTNTTSCNGAGIEWDCGGGSCSWSGPVVGGGGGGSSCPGECRQGSSCGAGYSGASGCSGSGPGGGCKSNQTCCSANSCGGGGGGGERAVCAPTRLPARDDQERHGRVVSL